MVEVLSQPEGAALERGASVGRYTILSLLGTGGHGEVFAAYDPELDRKVALKLLHASGDADDGRAQSRLLREAKAMARLSHRNVVAVHDVGAFGARVFVAMEFVDGLTLKDWLAARPRARADVLGVFTQAAHGLGAAHAVGLIHRDFKPGNVMIGHDGSVRVMDFGLARGLAAEDAAAAETETTNDEIDDLAPRAAGDLNVTLTATGELMGTPLYMSPEQFKAAPTDARTDQFSFCVALYQALYGAAPFGDASLAAIMAEVLAGRVRPAPPKSIVPAWLRRVLLRGLSLDPDARWSSMQELAAALGRDPARARRRVGLAVGVAGLVALSVVTRARGAPRAAPLCRDGETRFQGIWEGPATAAHPRRDAIQRALLATGVPGAGEVWERVATLLDRYVGDWLTMYRDACEATHVRGEQTAATLDLRMSCLVERRTALSALGDLLVHADRDVASNAIDAVHALPALAPCADVNQLRTAVEPPRDEATRRRVDDVRQRLAAAKALNDTGKHGEARERTRALVAEARRIGYGPLLADTLALLLHTYEGGEERADSEQDVEDALWTSLASARDELATDMAGRLASRVSWATSRQAEGAAWWRLAHALADRLGSGNELHRAWILQNEAIVRSAQNHPTEALALMRAALALKEKVLPPDDPDIARSVAGIADALHGMGQNEEALALNERAYAMFARGYGAASVEAAYTLSNRGEYMIDVGRAAEAISLLRQAATQWQAHTSPDNANLGYPLTALGRALLAAGRPDEAVTTLERALALRARETGLALVAETRFALARALWEANGDRPRALTLSAQARAAYVAEGDAARVAAVDTWRASTPGARRR